MADRVRKVRYAYVTVPSRAGQGERVFGALAEAGVNLLGTTGFPVGGGKAQLDVITEDTAALRRVARKNGWRLSKPKKAFLIQGDDRVGAFHRHMARLAEQKVNITAANSVSAGKGRYGVILWVKPKDYNRAAKALRAK